MCIYSCILKKSIPILLKVILYLEQSAVRVNTCATKEWTDAIFVQVKRKGINIQESPTLCSPNLGNSNQKLWHRVRE